MDEKDIYEKWSSNELERKCNNCDFKGTIADLDRITCSKYCGYAEYECDKCGFGNRECIIDNKMYKIQFAHYTKYCLHNSNEWILIWICNDCKKADDGKIIAEQIDDLFIHNQSKGRIYYDIIGNQIKPQVKENDLEYKIKKMFNVSY